MVMAGGQLSMLKIQIACPKNVEVAGLCDDNRTGLNKTLHPISQPPGAQGTTGGIPIRIARHVLGAAEDLLPCIIEKRAILLVGVPGVGKTTLLREVIRHLALRYGTKVAIVDSNSEVTGAEQIGHWATPPARRILISDKKSQPKLIRQACAHHSPSFIAVNAIGYYGDADATTSTIDRGVGMVVTCHGESLTNVVNIPTFWSVIGALREHGVTRQRMTKASFDVAVEVSGVDHFIVHGRVTKAVNETLAGREPRGIRVSNWLNLRLG